MCLPQNIYTQDFYYSLKGKVQLEISTQKILIQFNSNLDAEEQLQILSKQKNYLNIESIQKLPTPRVSILELENMPNSNSVNSLLQSLREEEGVDYANYFLIHPDGTLHGVTNQISLRLKSANQKSLLDHIIYDFQGVRSYTINPNDELLFEIEVNKNRNPLTLANEIHEYGIFEYCKPEFLRITKGKKNNDLIVTNQ
jgi:hypothetical protein